MATINPGSTAADSTRVETSFPDASHRYQYNTLADGEFRLVTIHPGTVDDAIHITLEEKTLQDADDTFQALSYTWAPLAPWKEVVCEGGATLPVTANLYDALVALRSHGQNVFWIDQLAINQQDFIEKGVQVQLMGQIYAKAKNVLIWLSAGIWYARQDAAHLNVFGCLSLRASTVGVEQALEDAATKGDLQVTDATWQAMFRLLQSDYFRRVWMVQEVVMAKQAWVMMFCTCLPWDDLILISSLFQSRLEIHYLTLQKLYPTVQFPPGMRRNTRSLQKMATIRTRLQPGSQNPWPGAKWTLLDMLRKTWNFEATDKRDKVYAMFGLLEFSEHCKPTSIVPDYSSKTTFESLISSVFSESLTSHGGLECLSYCTSLTKHTTPSWMGAVDISFYSPHEIIQHDLWDAGGMNKHQYSGHVRCVSGGNSLVSFRITHLGTMGHILGPFPGEPDMEARVQEAQEPKEYFGSQIRGLTFKELISYLESCEDLAHTTLSRQSVTSEEISDLFLRAFTFDIDVHYRDPVQSHLFRRNDGSPRYEFEDFVSNPRLLKLMDRLRFGVTEAASSRRNMPLLCWVPPSTKEGDVICVVHGYRFPMVIRRASGPDNSTYRFLGISYVQGYMDGEALEYELLKTEDVVFS